MANTNKVTEIKKSILKGMYQDTIDSFGLYQKNTGHFLNSVLLTTETGVC